MNSLLKQQGQGGQRSLFPIVQVKHLLLVPQTKGVVVYIYGLERVVTTACGNAVASRAMHISMLFHGQESPSHGILLAVVSFAFISLACPVVVSWNPESVQCPTSGCPGIFV